MGQGACNTPTTPPHPITARICRQGWSYELILLHLLGYRGPIEPCHVGPAGAACSNSFARWGNTVASHKKGWKRERAHCCLVELFRVRISAMARSGLRAPPKDGSPALRDEAKAEKTGSQWSKQYWWLPPGLVLVFVSRLLY